MKITKGMTFNYDGITWKVVKPGGTQSEAVAVTKSKAGEKKVIDNKIIIKAKPTMSESVETSRMQQLAGLITEAKTKSKDADSVMMDLETLIEEAWEAVQAHFGEIGVSESDYKKVEKAFSNMHKEFLKVEREL